MKLETEWRNIFRVLTTLDISKSGTVLVTEFEKCLTRYNVFLTREELDKIYSSFRVGAQLEFVRLSKEYGFHKQSYDRMSRFPTFLSPIGSSPKAVH